MPDTKYTTSSPFEPSAQVSKINAIGDGEYLASLDLFGSLMKTANFDEIEENIFLKF